MAGEKYKSSKSKKTMKERKVREPCRNCRLKCNEKIAGPQRMQIHREFWNHKTNIEQKRQFLCSCLEQTSVERKRQRTGSRAGKRQYNLKYFFTIEGTKYQVCKTFFLHTLDISQTFVRCALEKRQSSGIVESDKRGKQPSINKVKDEVKNRIPEHISAYPCEESHYSRRRTAKKYLGSHLNISTMYRMYKEDCDLKNIPPDEVVKEWLYSHIFNTEFNLSFAPPSNDTCDVCDEFLINLRQSDDAERETLQAQYNSHLVEADKRYNLKKEDKEMSYYRNGQKVLMIDLQKCLPCPKLTNAQSFYSLKLWCFNYTIYDSTEKQANCLMWDESIAGRGGNEMASCLVQYIGSLPESTTSIVIWSDNCPSQNRNLQMIMCYFYLLAINPHIKEISHKFLLRGHTHMEVDSVHSIIEREAKKCPNLHHGIGHSWLGFQVKTRISKCLK